ncbi:COPII subunit [Rhizophlyctis rosea]|nr:COPII subunit [Rhizophlyctis rosea]
MRPHVQTGGSPTSPNAPLVDPATGRVPPNFIPPVSGTPPPPVSTAPPGSRASRRAYPTSDPYGAGAPPQNIDPFSAQQAGGSPEYGRPQTPMTAGTPQFGGPQFGAPQGGPQMGGPQMGGPQMGGPQMGGPQMGGAQPPQFFSPADAQTPSFAPPGGQFGASVPSFGGAPQHPQQQPQGQWGQPQQQQPGVDGMGNLAGQFGNMSMAPGQPQGPAAINLLAGPPVLADLDAPAPVSWIPSSSSVSQAPTSNCDPKYKRCTINAIPQTTTLLNKCKIPLGLLITPYRHLLNGEEPVPVINPPQIVRCRRCRTYINPWVQFVEQGTRWKCNLCFLTNEVPTFFDWDPETRAHVDRMKRPELTHAVVEFIAPQEYMVRPPQPVVMLFVIDVSYSAVQSGMVATAARTILDTLDAIPNTDNRTKVGFITVDSSLHFYNLNPSLSEPQMLIVSDLDETFLPMPYDLLVSLSESRAVIETLLSRLGDMFKNTQSVQNVLGRALQAAHKMISPIGGKIIVLQSTLPNSNEGALKPREDPKLLGTPKEVTLLQPQTPFYKNLAVTCSPTQVSIDVFLFSAQYADVATLSGCAKFTGGSVYFYPNFNAARPDDALKFANEFSHFLSRPIGLEAVMRVRASKGIRMTGFHGNFFLRSTDLLSLPNVSPDNSYAVEMTLIENLTTSLACFQTALLHTSSSGERRIRVLTLAIPVTNNLSDIFASTDQFAVTSLLAKKAVERALTSKIEDARDALMYKLNEMMAAYKQSFTTSSQATQLLLPENLKLLPLLTLGMLKNTAFRASSNVPSDLRSYIMALLYVFPPELCIIHTHPRFYALHVLEPQVGLPGEDGQIVYPPRLNLSSEKLERHGLYFLENGVEMFLWVGRAVAPQLCQLLFDKPSYDAIVPGKTTLPTPQNDYSTRMQNLIGKVRELRIQMATCYPHLYVVKEDGDPSLRMWFLSQLVEDRIDASYSYPQFLGVLREQMGKVSSS